MLSSSYRDRFLSSVMSMIVSPLGWYRSWRPARHPAFRTPLGAMLSVRSGSVSGELQQHPVTLVVRFDVDRGQLVAGLHVDDGAVGVTWVLLDEVLKLVKQCSQRHDRSPLGFGLAAGAVNGTRPPTTLAVSALRISRRSCRTHRRGIRRDVHARRRAYPAPLPRRRS